MPITLKDISEIIELQFQLTGGRPDVIFISLTDLIYLFDESYDIEETARLAFGLEVKASRSGSTYLI